MYFLLSIAYKIQYLLAKYLLLKFGMSYFAEILVRIIRKGHYVAGYIVSLTR